jgi:hypothetical protein
MLYVGAYLLLALALALNEHARASHPSNHARARSRSFVPHARRVTRSSYMAHPVEVR